MYVCPSHAKDDMRSRFAVGVGGHDEQFLLEVSDAFEFVDLRQ